MTMSRATADRAFLAAIEAEIPALEEKLRAMKMTRKRIKAAAHLRALWKDRAFKKANAERNQQRWLANPDEQRRLAGIRYTTPKLPWRLGTAERNRYRCLTRKGWTRELAIEKIRAEAA